MKRTLEIGLFLTALLIAPPLLSGNDMTAEQRGMAIAEEANRRNSGYEDSTANLRMILRNKQGQTSERELHIRTLEMEGDETRSLCIFDSPRDVRGTILLTHTSKDTNDNQWLYLPALRRVRRIAAQNKSGSFMGSEFAYEDIAVEKLERHTYKWLRDEVYEGTECYVIERYPVDKKNSGYSRQVAWIGTQEYRTWKVDYYDRKDALLKTLTFKGYRKYLDAFWRAQDMDMINHQTGKSTRLVWSEFNFRTGQNAIDFERQSLTLLR